MRTFRTSAGLPATPPMNPDVQAIPTSVSRPGEEEEELGEGVAKRFFNSSYMPNLVVE